MWIHYTNQGGHLRAGKKKKNKEKEQKRKQVSEPDKQLIKKKTIKDLHYFKESLNFFDLRWKFSF